MGSDRRDRGDKRLGEKARTFHRTEPSFAEKTPAEIAEPIKSLELHIQKPFSIDALAAKVRETLDQ